MKVTFIYSLLINMAVSLVFVPQNQIYKPQEMNKPWS